MREKKSVLGWVLTFAGEKKRDYLASAALAILGSVCQLLPYLVMARVLTRLLAGDRDLIAYLRDCGLLALLWLARLGLHSLSTARSHAATFAVLAGIRKRGLEKLARMPLGDIQARGTGELKNILVERVDSMEPTLAHAIPEISGNAAAALATLLCLFLLDWRMALAALLPLPLGLVFFALMMRGYQENYQRASAATKVLNDTAVEYIGGIEVIKVFGKAKSSYEKFVTAARDCAESYIDWMRKSNFYFTFAMNVMPATLLTVLPIGGLLLRSGTLAPDRFVLLLILSLGLVPPIIGCMKFTDDLAKVGTIIGQVTDILTAPELPRPETDRAMPRDHSVELRNVRFGYGETEVLHGIDLTFREGTVNALVGPSGSGKSTIAKLIASFWDVGGGSITIGGADLRDLSAERCQSLIAYVSQESFLFDTTVRENIRMGRPSATDAEVERAARESGCYDFILGLENGFETRVGGGGGASLRRGAAAPLHCPGHAEGRPHRPPGRGHRLHRPGERGRHPGERREAGPGQDPHRHRPPALHHRGRRPDRRGERRADRGRRHPGRAAGGLPPVPAALGGPPLRPGFHGGRDGACLRSFGNSSPSAARRSGGSSTAPSPWAWRRPSSPPGSSRPSA